MSAPGIDSTERNGNPVLALSGSARDASGSSIFSVGNVGEAHVMAHRLFDEGRSQLGRAWLGRWLTHHTGPDSDWIHLELHMALFELVTGS
jgi:hypothetical protein